MKNFLAHTDEIREEMLREISCASIEDLFKEELMKCATPSSSLKLRIAST